jgi:hypothetical protein
LGCVCVCVVGLACDCFVTVGFWVCVLVCGGWELWEERVMWRVGSRQCDSQGRASHRTVAVSWNRR